MEPRSWVKKGISSGRNFHKKQAYGHSGMIVIACIEADVPRSSKTERQPAEKYAHCQ